MKITDLSKNQSAIVKRIDLSGITKKRFEDLGLTENVKITFIRNSPFSSLVELKLRDFFLAILRKDAENITVEIINE